MVGRLPMISGSRRKPVAGSAETGAASVAFTGKGLACMVVCIHRGTVPA